MNRVSMLRYHYHLRAFVKLMGMAHLKKGKRVFNKIVNENVEPTSITNLQSWAARTLTIIYYIIHIHYILYVPG